MPTTLPDRTPIVQQLYCLLVNVRNKGGGQRAPSPAACSGAYERSKSMIQVSIDEAGDGTNAGSMGLPVVTILLGQGLVASQASDGVLDGDTLGSKRGVVGDVLGRSGLLAGLAAGGEAEA